MVPIMTKCGQKGRVNTYRRRNRSCIGLDHLIYRWDKFWMKEGVVAKTLQEGEVAKGSG